MLKNLVGKGSIIEDGFLEMRNNKSKNGSIGNNLLNS